MPGWYETLLIWLEYTRIATSVRQSLWLYPVAQVVHITGIVMLVGPVMIFDLRLMGFIRRLSVHDLGRYLIPLSKMGFVITVISGIALFVAHATDWGVNLLFGIKILLIFVAVFNAVHFSKSILKHLGRWEAAGFLPLRARISGALSLLFWLLIIIAGRFLAYY